MIRSIFSNTQCRINEKDVKFKIGFHAVPSMSYVLITNDDDVRHALTTKFPKATSHAYD